MASFESLSSFERFTPQFSQNDKHTIELLTQALTARMSEVNPRRFAHCKSVAQTAAYMAKVYQQNQTHAYIAGLLHDWDKILSTPDQIEKAQHYDIDMGAPLEQTCHLLHGLTAACELHERFPKLSDDIINAIRYHTVARTNMSALDMIVFVADGIEPLRKPYPTLDAIRASVGTQPLERVFFESFTSGLVYVLKTQRYLYPPSIQLYNHYIRTFAHVGK